MSNTIHSELVELAAEFAALRRSDNKKWFPEIIWKKAVALAQQSSVSKVCQAIKVPPSYLKRKMTFLAQSESEITFVELITPKHQPSHIVRINFESSSGHKMIIDGIESTAVASILAEFLRAGGYPCCK